MELKIKNIGKIQDAHIVFNGITVLCGENNTGKSTVGKVLFSLFNSTVDFDEKVNDMRYKEFILSVRNNIIYDKRVTTGNFSISRSIASKIYDYIIDLDHFPQTDEIEKVLSEHRDRINVKEVASDIVEIISTPDLKILDEYIFRLFNEIFSDQICYSNKGRNQSYIKIKIKDKINTISFYNKFARYTERIPITHKAYYIDNPFVVDNLNDDIFNSRNELQKNVVSAIRRAMLEITEDKMSGIIDVVSNKEKIESVFKILQRVFNGKIINKEGLFYYNENGIDVDVRNVSAGLKAFILIERLISSGKLKTKDVLILDEPEIHLHPQWQIIYAELIVVLQKEFDLTVLINTHSTIFLQALNIAARRNQQENIDFYLSDPGRNSFKHLDKSDISEVYNQTNIVTNKLLDEEFNMDFDGLD